MKIVSFSIFKGGTGKTTSAVSTAAALVKKGKKVLLVDLDQQASATRYLDLDPEQSPNLYEVFTGTKPAQLAIKKTSLILMYSPLMFCLPQLKKLLSLEMNLNYHKY